MKKLILFMLLLIIAACSAPDLKELSYQEKIGIVNTLPSIYIPEHEFHWNGLEESGLGLWSAGTYSVTKTIANDTTLNYSCWVANKKGPDGNFDYSGASDFVVKMSEDGIPINPLSGDYNFPGMLSITTFQNGLPIAQVEKQRFYVTPTDFMIGHDYFAMRQYGADTMSIPCGTSDEYVNRAKVRGGKNLIVVEINPDKLIVERDYTDNVSVLPVNVTFGTFAGVRVGTGVLDHSAILENQAHPVTNIVPTKNFQGANKFVSLDWDCPYHEPIYVKHWFTIKKNGNILADNIESSNFTEKIKGSYRTSVYEVFVTVKGLGTSLATTITVTR